MSIEAPSSETVVIGPIVLEGQTAAELSRMTGETGMTVDQLIAESVRMRLDLRKARAAGFTILAFRHRRHHEDELLELQDLR
jgi:hypothetical protein